MPTSEEFSEVAAGLKRLVADLDELSLPLENAMGSHVLEGGELTDSVYESIKGTRITAQALGATIDDYAAEAARRQAEAEAAAEAQADYRKDLERYEFEMRVRANYDEAGFTQRQRAEINARRAGVDVHGDPPTKPTPPPATSADYIDL